LDAGVPVLDIKVGKIDAHHIGGLILLFEAACACAGIISGINPFDQPGVEAGKKMALGLLGREGFSEYAQRVYLREELGIS
jgi:glucose-6-phosphate isomerase